VKAERAQALISGFNVQILVIGDVILDRFVWGTVNRSSPEAASCPVLEYTDEVQMLGGAGNVATNLVSLGAKCVRLVGLSGHDSDGHDLKLLMQQQTTENRIDDLVVRTDRQTTVKTRFVSKQDSRHLLRADKEDTHPCSEQEQAFMFSQIRHMMPLVAGVILEDYGKGVLTRDFIKTIMDMAKEANVPVFVDPKSDHWEYFKGAELVKPNMDEAFAALGKVALDGCPQCEVEEVGESLLLYTRAKSIIITRGGDGMHLFSTEYKGEPAKIIHKAWIDSYAGVQIVDLSGAGDTSMAALVLSRIAGATWEEAMDLANAAAGIAVCKQGTATVTTEELLNSFSD